MTNFEEEILDYVRQHPGCRIQDMVAGTKCTYTEIVSVIEDMVNTKQLDRWYSFGTPYFYLPGTYTPPHLRPYTPPNLREPSKEHEKTGNKYIAAYLDAFDEFCDEVRTRYDEDVIRDLTPEVMISLYRGFIAALPAIKKDGTLIEKTKAEQSA